MRTLIGPMECKDCRAHVWGVRRDVELRCGSDEVVECRGHGAKFGVNPCICHSHTVPSVGPFTVVEANGERHLCAEAAAA